MELEIGKSTLISVHKNEDQPQNQIINLSMNGKSSYYTK